MSIQPFTINVDQATLDDLKLRLARTRWPDQIDGAGWQYGTNLEYLQSLVEYWQHTFDWRAQEAKLNQFTQFKTEIDGLDIHFIHERGKGPNPRPIILTHGWPDSFFRMVKIIPMLSDPARYGGDPADSFDVIVPSLPGHGFSDRPRERGMRSEHIAALWAQLMSALGYERFGAAGGDIGSEVTLHLAHQHPERLAGIHLTDASYPMAAPEGMTSDADAERYFAALQHWFHQESAYMMLQSSKPQTLGYGLNDSPVALAAWIVEKFRAWSDCGGDVERRFTKDELLTNIMIYWATETITSSARRYYENAQGGTPLWPAPRIDVPVGVAQFSSELLPPRAWVEHAMNVQRWTAIPRGGHFAALEEPKLFADDLRAFFHDLKLKDS